MASAGKLVATYGVKFGQTDKLGSTYTGEDGYLYVSSGYYTYYDIPGSNVSFTTSVSNGIYLLRADLTCYISGAAGNGVNAAFKWDGIRICGTEGSSGDTWQRGGHGDTDHNGSFSICRMYVHAPGLPAGTTVNANCMGGGWGDAHYWNYPNYATHCDFYIMEFEPVT